MRTRTLTNVERALIIGLRQGGMRPSDIAKDLSMPRSTVSTVLTKWKISGCMTTQSGGHNSCKLSDRALRNLAQDIQQDRRQHLTSLAAKYQVHHNTMRKYIRNLGFGNCIASKKPYLNLVQKATRLAFARKYKHWTEQDWYKVIWTDESSFELGKNSRQIRVWRKPYEKYMTECLAPTFKSGRTSVMTWGAFTGFDKCPLVIMPQGERTAAHFVKNVYESTLSGFYFMHDNPHDLTLMEDGAPVHRSKLAENWRLAYGMKKLKWPSNSPDLNPIENIWKILKDWLRYHSMPQNKQELIECIQKVWDEVPLEQLKCLISTMPNRIKAVISARGGSTRW